MQTQLIRTTSTVLQALQQGIMTLRHDVYDVTQTSDCIIKTKHDQAIVLSRLMKSLVALSGCKSVIIEFLRMLLQKDCVCCAADAVAVNFLSSFVA